MFSQQHLIVKISSCERCETWYCLPTLQTITREIVFSSGPVLWDLVQSTDYHLLGQLVFRSGPVRPDTVYRLSSVRTTCVQIWSCETWYSLQIIICEDNLCSDLELWDLLQSTDYHLLRQLLFRSGTVRPGTVYRLSSVKTIFVQIWSCETWYSLQIIVC